MEHENAKLMRRWFQEVWNEGRMETIDELMAPDGVAHDVTGQGVDLHGPEEFKKAATALRSAFPDMHVTMDDVLADGDRAAMRVSVQMTHSGPLGPLAPTGARVSTPVMCIVRMKDGKITEGWNYWDIASVLRAAAAPANQSCLL